MGFPYFWRTTRINSFSKKSRTTWEIEMKLWHSQQNYLRNISRSKSHLSKVSAHVQMTHFSTWPHFTNLLQYLACEIDILLYEVGNMLRPWNFLENGFWQRKLIGEAIVSFCWRHQKLVSGGYSTRQSRELANDITNCHFFVREFPGTSFNWDTRDVAYVPLYTHNILEKGEGWKLWYSFESLALRYSPKNLPHLLKVSTYFTRWNWYFCLCIRRVTEVLK